MNMTLHGCLSGESSDEFKRTIKGSVSSRSDTSSYAWNLLGKRWTFLIIAELLGSSQSFHELFEHIQGISESMLADRLKELEREGVVRRQVYTKRPIRVMYYLTAKGEALEPVIRAIDVWSQFL